MRKPFRAQTAAVTAAFLIAPLSPSIFIPVYSSVQIDMVV